MTMTLIKTTTVASAVASVDMTAIPGTYTDLLVTFSARSTVAGGPFDNLLITFNNTTSGYTDRALYGTGSSAASASGSGNPSFVFTYSVGNAATASTFGNGQIYIPNYAGSTNKSVSFDSVTENNSTSAIAAISAGLWSNTSAITSIKFTAATSAELMIGTTISVYGITKGSGGATVSP